jgi:putative ABC transport system permease protein
VLRDETSRTAGSAGQQGIRRALIGSQALLAALLLVAAGIFAQGLRELMRVDTGFDPRNVLTFRTDPPYGRYPDIATTSEFYRRASETLMTQPGIETAGTNSFLPFSGLDVSSPRLIVEGRTTPGEEPFVNLQLVGGDYFRTMRIPLQRGRLFERTDDLSSPAVAIVSARAARRLWPNDDPVGRRVQVVWNQQGTGGGGGSVVWLTVVGVVGDVRFSGMDDTSSLDMYAPNTQLFAGDSYFVVRTHVPPEALRQRVRAAIDAIDRDQSFFDVQTMDARVERVVWQQRVATAVLGVFGTIALCLAIIGVYAVTAHAVASERREIGIRLALGSPRTAIIGLTMRRWLTPVAVGIAGGIVSGVLTARALGALIGSVAQPDIVTAAMFPFALGAAAVVACWLPVWRVLRHMELTRTLRDPA